MPSLKSDWLSANANVRGINDHGPRINAIYIICFRLFPGTNKYVDLTTKGSEVKQ